MLRFAGNALGFIGFVNSTSDFLDDRNPSSFIKAGANLGLIFVKATPTGFLISTGYSLFEANGGVEWMVNNVSGLINK